MGMKIYAIRALQISQFLFKTAAAQGKKQDNIIPADGINAAKKYIIKRG